jgi:Uncharacterised nucleotidyltransferase
MSAPSAEDTRQEITLLLRLLRPAGVTELDWAPIAHWDWRGFARVCDHHDVAPFIYCRLRGTAGITVPRELLEHLRLSFFEVSGRNYHLAQKLVDLTALLKEHQIPVLAYKGPTLAMIAYGDLALRSYQDLDLVIRPKHLQAALGVMTRCGFEVTPDWWNACRPENPRYVARHHEIPLRAPDKSYFVDLHWQLAAYEARAFRLDVDEAWSRAGTVTLLQADISTLSSEDLFLALCCHGTWHRWERLKWLLDIAELLRNAETLNWSRIEEMIRNRPLVGASASLAVSLARELLDIDVPVEAALILPANERISTMAAAIRDEILSQGQTSGKNWTALLGLEGSSLAWMKYLGVQSAWLLHRVFVQVGPKERALVPLPERLKFLYHFIRPVRLAIEHSRRLARTIWPMAVF